MTKVILRGQEPIQFKAGIAVKLYKGSGTMYLMEFYRSILLNNSIAKHYHKWLRGVTLQTCDELLRCTQHGGIPKRSGAHSTHSVKAFLRVCRKRKVTAVVALLDLRQALYSVIREFVLGKGGTTPELQQVMDGLDPPPWLKQAMELIVNQPGFLARHQTDENWRRHAGKLSSR